MRFRFLWVGKTRNRDWRALQDEYFGRLTQFIKCDVTEVKDSAPHEGPSEEGERLLKSVSPADLVVLLDVKGKQIGSHQLARQIEDWQMAARKEIVFVIGGAHGVSPEVAERADLRLSLSFLTFTHEMARVILLEQLYRAFSIIKGFPYQK
ncbi:MAG TPA: 23S rRNA (pseudouridine(1915)-N(3))-methyltransferase RlmH [Pyrinomonadaceae bacterium]|nr:23S rRNA (pseudouridine(1915)-N(3))-methyltransferase RlmH [Pyrinomonadaceae bacterium]